MDVHTRRRWWWWWCSARLALGRGVDRRARRCAREQLGSQRLATETARNVAVASASMPRAQGAEGLPAPVRRASPFAAERFAAGVFERYAGLWPGADPGSGSPSGATTAAALLTPVPPDPDLESGSQRKMSDARDDERARPRRRRRARRKVFMGLSLVLAVLGAAAMVWLVVLHPEATRLGLRQALALYHQDSAHRNRAGLPPPGVYRYVTSGAEHLSFGGITRSFPASSSMIVAAARCATFTWEPLVQHVETLTVCPQADGARSVRQASSTETIVGTTTTSVIRCPATAWFLPAHPLVGQRWHATCTMAGHPVAFDGAVLGRSEVSVGGEQVPALQTRLTWIFAGAERGVNPNEYWLHPSDAMILAQHETVDVAEGSGPLGSVRYTEDMTIHLRSLEPVR